MTDTSDPYDGEDFDELLDENGDPVEPVSLDDLLAELGVE